MKKYIILLLLFVTATAVHAQDVATKVIRIPDAATSLAQAIPVGTHVYDIANQQTYVATAGVAAGQSLTTAAASFKLISGTTAVTDNLTSTSTTDALSANQGKVLQDGKLDKTAAFVGDVTGTYNSTKVAAIDGTAVDMTTAAPTDGQVLKWNNTDNAWQPANDVVFNPLIDNLTSSSIINGLTANQGRVLEDKKADKDNVLELDNASTFYPTTDFHPATKKYVDDTVGDYIPHSLLPDGQILIGNTIPGSSPAVNYATAHTLSGDASLANDGTLTIADDAVDGSDISIAGETAGDMAYFNGTEWVRLPKGAANQSLVMDATATAPQWQSGGATEDVETVLATATGGNGTTLAIPANVSDYEYLRLETDDWIVSPNPKGHTLHATVLVSNMANRRVLLYFEPAPTSHHLYGDINASGTSIQITTNGSATYRLVGIKAQKLVIDPSLTTVIDDDSFATATDANVPSAESVKEYVDANGRNVAGQTAGDMTYFDGTDWVRLPKGLANQSLVMDATATAPEWQSGGATEDKKVLLGSATGLTHGQTVSIGATTWGALAADYELVEFRTVGNEANNRHRYSSYMATANWQNGSAHSVYHDGVSFIDFHYMDVAGNTATFSEGGTAWDSIDIEIYGVKPQKVVIDPSLTTVIDDDSFATATASNVPSAESVKAYVDANGAPINDQSASGYMDIGNMRIQWGNAIYTGGQMVVNLPAPFANFGYSVVAQTMYNPGGAATTGGARGPMDANSFRVFFTYANFSSTANPTNHPFSWQAIGLKP